MAIKIKIIDGNVIHRTKSLTEDVAILSLGKKTVNVFPQI